MIIIMIPSMKCSKPSISNTYFFATLGRGLVELAIIIIIPYQVLLEIFKIIGTDIMTPPAPFHVVYSMLKV